MPTARKLLLPLLGTSLLLAAGAVQALPTDRDQPIKVAADSASFDQKSGQAVYRGNVIIQQGTLEVRADEVTLTVDKQGAVQKSVAKGNPAHYQQKQDEKKGLVTAEAQQIVYDAKSDSMIMTGNAKLKQDSSSFQGSTITYYISKQQADASGDKNNRVQIEFKPQPRDTTLPAPAPIKDKAK